MKKQVIREKDRIKLEDSKLPLCIYQFNSGKISAILASKGFCNIFGLNNEETLYFLNNDRYRYYSPDFKNTAAEIFYHFEIMGGLYEHDFKFKRTVDGEYIDMFSRGLHVYTNDGTRLMIVFYFYDPVLIERYKRQEINFSLLEKIVTELTDNYLSFAKVRDERTGLLSMPYFLELSKSFFNKDINENHSPTTLAFDLIGMRKFNEKYSYEEGNKLIEKFGTILRRNFGDYSCSRFSADHFYVFTNDIDIEKRIEKVFEELSNENDGKTIPVRCGIYINRTGKLVEGRTSCDRAKIACDTEENAVSSVYVFFDDDMFRTLQNEAYVINNLDKAIEEKWIKVYYQPIIRGITGKVCDYEALARWLDPIRGLLSPKEFIPILENAKLLYKLDLYMLDSILEDFSKKESLGIPLVPVSINLSRYDFEACDIVEEIRKKVEESGYPFNLITVEITESVVGQDPEFLKEQVDRFHKIGFNVWMDDFGTGYSTLNILSDFDFDLVKLDMDIISRYKENPRVSITIRNLIEMSEELGIDFLCEGVETKEEADFLIKNGCDKIQGFYYGKPVPFEVECNNSFNKRFELPKESSYYERISTESLNNFASNDKYGSYISSLVGDNIGIVEYINGEYYLLRSTKNYKEFLKSYSAFGKGDESKLILTYDTNFYQIFNSLVEKTIETKEWETSLYKMRDGLFINMNVRCIESNEVTGGHAIMVVVSTSRDRNSELHEKYVPTLPVPFAVFKVVTNKKGDEVVDTEYVYANFVYCKSINIEFSKLVGRRYLKITPNASKIWFPYCYQAAVLKRTVSGTIYSPEIKQWLTFVVSPTNEPMCCSFVFMNFDKENEENAYLKTKSETEEAIIKVSRALTYSGKDKKPYIKALDEINKIFYPEYLFLIKDTEEEKDIVLEASIFNKNKEDLDLIRNEYLELIKSNLDKVDDDGFVFINDKKGKQIFFGTSKITYKNVAIVVLKDHTDNIIGYLGLVNYREPENIDYKKILKTISLYLTSRIVENMIVKKLERQSEHDALTDVLNRKGFATRANKCILDNPQSSAVYMIMDIDDFKFINDLYGHYVGDQILIHFAHIIEEHFGKNSIIGRSGGDEFQVLLPNTNLRQAVPIISKFSYMKKKLVVNDKEIVYEASIGYVEYPTQAKDSVELMKFADAALYYSKTNQGSSASTYKPEMDLSRRSQLGFGLKDIAGNMPAAMLIYEALGDEKILYVNDELVKMFECDSREEFMEHVRGSFMGLVHPDDLDHTEASIWKQINESKGDQDNDFVDYRIITKKGNVKRIIDNGRLVESKFYGKVFYVILIEEEPHTDFQKRIKE
ncbi:MAG: EAL domain-containing protein [Gammaproteobacteria bacterium]|nr:EAL domain-containing protein [Gammaproteobacteria bacterium]